MLTLSGELDMETPVSVAARLRPLLEAGGSIIVENRGCVILHGAHGAVSRIIERTQLQSARPNIHIIDRTLLAAAA